MMSSAVLDLFPGLTLQGVTSLPFAVTFDCPLVAGKFEPSQVGQVLFHTANAGMLYYLDDLTVGCDVSELDFSAALVDRLNLDILQSNSNALASAYRLNKSMIPIVAAGSIPMQMWYKVMYLGSKKTSSINMRISGQVNQTPALIAKATLKIFVRGIVYQISDTNWIKKQLGG